MPWTNIKNIFRCKLLLLSCMPMIITCADNLKSGKASQTTGLIFAMFNIGAIPAVFCTGPVNDLYGRRM
jgi:MFS family permease